MKNTVKISAAGSGKTYDICHEALATVQNTNKRCLIVTYTNRGRLSVETELKKQNGGVLHPCVVIKTWYRFLLSDTIKPYQRLIMDGKFFNILRGIDFSQTYGSINYYRQGEVTRYVTRKRNILSNQASELAWLLNRMGKGNTVRRLEAIYSDIFFDEVQDLAGYDVELLKNLLDSEINITCCGDNKQATFSTHNAKKNKSKTGKNIWQFFSSSQNITVEHKLESRRFNKDICAFANLVFPVGDPVSTIMTDVTEHDGVFLIKEEDVDTYYNCFRPHVLRYDARTVIEKYYSLNFGACKGETFDRVLIYPNGPLSDFVLKGKMLDKPQKYYVGVTRPRYSIAIVFKKLPDTLNGFEHVSVGCGCKTICSLRFIPPK